MKVSWDDYSKYMAWKNDIHVPNHQPVTICYLQVNIAIENGPFVVVLPIKDGDFP